GHARDIVLSDRTESPALRFLEVPLALERLADAQNDSAATLLADPRAPGRRAPFFGFTSEIVPISVVSWC
ncbi:MAG: hypothetical protein KDJ78_17895, partial [Rhodobacteraceae bacterium]|nr:hypothetical protein [Paracoccaceae bacterium]